MDKLEEVQNSINKIEQKTRSLEKKKSVNSQASDYQIKSNDSQVI